jgi:hypothetical protein
MNGAVQNRFAREMPAGERIGRQYANGEAHNRCSNGDPERKQDCGPFGGRQVNPLKGGRREQNEVPSACHNVGIVVNNISKWRGEHLPLTGERCPLFGPAAGLALGCPALRDPGSRGEDGSQQTGQRSVKVRTTSSGAVVTVLARGASAVPPHVR